MANSKVALVTGVTGQDGAYLTDQLLKKGYEVHGLRRRSSSFNLGRIYQWIEGELRNPHFHLHAADLTDGASIFRIMQEVKPTEVYNLAAQSHVQTSFESPEYTANADALGTLRLLEALRASGRHKETRFYQASTSELFGKVQEVPQTEKTPFYPRSPYGVAKIYSYWITVNYREAYDLPASNGILFNHESPLRGELFVTRKITKGVSRIKYGLSDCLHLGNLDAQRDWGHAREFTDGMWRILQHDKAEDFVLATGRTTRVREFARMAFAHAGIDIEFSGQGVEEVGVCRKTGKTLLRIDPRFYRPTEVDLLIGNAEKAKKLLGWTAKVSVEELCREMMEADLFRASEEKKALDSGVQSVEMQALERKFLQNAFHGEL